MNQDGDVEGLEIDAATLHLVQTRLQGEQNLPLAIVGGLVAALVGAAIWAAVTVATGYQIGWMAVGVGFLVGLAVRVLGKGITPIFGVIGAAGALFGCLLGNLLSVCGFFAGNQGVPFLELTLSTLTDPSAIIDLFKATFHPMDLLFYGIAVYQGYQFAFRNVTVEDIKAVQCGR
ncbi:MAG: hypothetical protein ACK557_20410 [Planctomycetota bacterium]